MTDSVTAVSATDEMRPSTISMRLPTNGASVIAPASVRRTRTSVPNAGDGESIGV